MRFYSTNNKSIRVDLQHAVTGGLAPDNGLYMPEKIPQLPGDFFSGISQRSFRDNAFLIASALLGDSLPEPELRRIIDHTITFDAPLVEVERDVYALELFHGPTLAFKDFGARFMSQMLGYFARQQHREIVILVATSGDTGSAVANGFLGIEGTRVVVLYPSGKVSEIQEKQFTTLGSNVTALEVNGTFDDCQRLVKQAFLDPEVRRKHFLTSANSINIARLVPQSFYYFHAYAQLIRKDLPLVFSVPSGNFGNLTGGLLAKRMGLPVARFLAATNVNRIVPDYLSTGVFSPKPSVSTISNAMDVGNPSNFVRMLDLFEDDILRFREEITGAYYTDSSTRETMKAVFRDSGYVLDPHGAIGYAALKDYSNAHPGRMNGIFLETAHPAKFKETVDQTLQQDIPIPLPLREFMKHEKKTLKMESDYDSFRTFLNDTL
jgi:threonine synthase